MRIVSMITKLIEKPPPVLGGARNHFASRPIPVACSITKNSMRTRLSIEFVAWLSALLDEMPTARRPNAVRHLEEASTSVALNIAEGNGKRSVADRVRYLEIARGSALECAACLDVLVVRSRLTGDASMIGKRTLVRIVSMITKLIEKLLERSSTSTSTSTSRTRD